MSINIDRIIEASRPTSADIDAEFTPETRSRILDDIVGAGKVVPLASRRHSRRWLGLVAAGVVVAVGGLTVQALLPSRTTTVVTQNPSGGVTTTTVTQPPVGLPVAAALEPIAQAAEKRPDLTPVGRKYFHLVTVRNQIGNSAGTNTTELFVAADGWTWAHRVEGGLPDFWMLYDSKIENYSTLPSDPKKLDATLRARGGSNSGDERVYKGIDEILVSLSAPPAIKAAAIRVLDNLSKNPQAPEKRNGLLATPKVTVTPTTVKGHPAVMATLTDATSRPGISYSMALDSTTGDLLESGSSSPDQTSSGTYLVRELVDTLPAEIVTVLGTARVHQEIWK